MIDHGGGRVCRGGLWPPTPRKPGQIKATVTIIDNTTGVALLSCTVNSASKGKCANTGTASVAAAAGDRLELKVTASGSNCNNKQWQARFRYQ